MTDTETLADLLSEALDLCVRGRVLSDRAAIGLPEWVIEQYEIKIVSWEQRARAALGRVL